MTRIIAGTARGRRLRVPSEGTRPTSDRAREAVFSALQSLRPDLWDGAVVLDLYAGSGALGLEALSRGAARVDLVEADRAAGRVVRANLAVVAPVPGRADLHRSKVERWVLNPPSGVRYDVVFCDPPYAQPQQVTGEALTRLAASGALAADALVVVERAQRESWSWPAPFHALGERRYGEARIWTARV